MTILLDKLTKIADNKIHSYKCKAEKEISQELWAKFPSRQMAVEIVTEMLEVLEAFAYIPCCHVSGTHDPEHFKRGIICDMQKAEAFERLCKDLEINPITKSKLNCYWCMSDPTNRKGEGVHLFPIETIELAEEAEKEKE